MAFLLVAFLLGGCPNAYEVTKTENGAVLKINKSTGETVLIKQDGTATIIQPDVPPNPKKTEAELIKLKSTPVALPETDQNVKILLNYRYREGAIEYKASFSTEKCSFISDLFSNENHISMVFFDGDGFQVIVVPLKNPRTIVGEDGQTVSLDVEGSMPIRASDFARIEKAVLRSFLWVLEGSDRNAV
jgi:hypothetical protein